MLRVRLFEQAKHDPGVGTPTQPPEKPFWFSIGCGDISISCESEAYKEWARYTDLISKKLAWLTPTPFYEAQACQFEKDNLDQAVTLYEQSVADWETSERPYRRLRIIYAEKGQWEDATRVCILYIRILEYVRACGWPGVKAEHKAGYENHNNAKRAEYLSWIEKYQNPSWIEKYQSKKRSKKRRTKQGAKQEGDNSIPGSH